MFTYTIVLAHSIVPHHHHDDHKILHASAHVDADHSIHSSEEGLAHQFGNYMHSGNSSDVYAQPDNNFKFSESDLSVFPLLFSSVIIAKESVSIVLVTPLFSLSKNCCSSSGLRAPPIHF